MAEKVGEIYYNVTLDTQEMINGQRKVDRELKNTTASLDGFQAKLTQVAKAVTVLAVAMAVLKSAQLADEIRLMGARVQVAAGNIDAGTTAMARLVEISRITQTAVAGNVEVFTRLNQSILQMGGTQSDTLRITELLGKAIKVSGASAMEAKSAMIQFGQALGSGKLQGDELRSLMETAPYLMQQLADGIGVPRGALKKLGEEGKLTSDVIVNALSKAASKIESDFQQFPQTVGGALQLVVDAAERANERLDTLTGTSTAITGAAKGLGEVLDKLAAQFGASNEEAGKLGRNSAIKTWADETKVVLSYIVDAADIVWQTLSVLGRNVAFVFTGLGNEIGGIGAQIASVMRGDFAGAKAIGQAMVVDSAQRRAVLDAADAKTLAKRELFGEQMRKAWEQGAGGGRGSVNPTAAASVLKSTTDTSAADKKAALAAKRLATQALAAQEYYDGLVAGNKTAADKIDADEAKALTENQKRRVSDGHNAEIYEKAKIEIQRKFSVERILLAKKTADDIALVEDRDAQARAEAGILLTTNAEQRIVLIRDEAMRQAEASYRRGQATLEETETAKTKAIQAAIDQQKALQLSRQGFALGTLQIKADGGGAQDQENLVAAKAAADMAAVEALRLLDLSNSQLYADQKVAIEAKMQQDIADLRANANTSATASTASMFDSLVSITKNAAGEQSAAYKVAFAAQKAYSIASAIIAIQTGLSKAASEPWPLNLAAMASVAAATAGIVSTISGTSYGGARRYGGPTAAGSMYRVNETGAPEMFTGSNGQQYMLPTKSGNVTPADGVGGGNVEWKIIINNNAAGVQASASVDQSSKTVEIAIAEIANQFANNTGPAWRALTSGSNVRAGGL